MSASTSIEWTDATWSPIRARRRDTGKVGQHCERVSPGCTNCYAATHNRRNLPTGGTGLDYVRGSRDLVETFVDERVLAQPLRWREPKRIFVANQTDFFGEFYTDEQIAAVFGLMAAARHHTFQVLTKRPERMRRFLKGETCPPHASMREWCFYAAQRLVGHAALRERNPWDHEFPLPNVWLGVTAEDQQRADERIPILLDTPAAVRFVSAEPLLGPVNLRSVRRDPASRALLDALDPAETGRMHPLQNRGPGLDWCIVGGESGSNSRPCDVEWIRSIVKQCRAAGVPAFVKQLGAHPIMLGHREPDWNPIAIETTALGSGCWRLRLRDGKGGDPEEWPSDLRIREFPKAREAVRT